MEAVSEDLRVGSLIYVQDADDSYYVDLVVSAERVQVNEFSFFQARFLYVCATESGGDGVTVFHNIEMGERDRVLVR